MKTKKKKFKGNWLSAQEVGYVDSFKKDVNNILKSGHKKQPRFKVGDEVVLTYNGKHPTEDQNYAELCGIKPLTPVTVITSGIMRNIFSRLQNSYDTIYTSRGLRLGHPAAKFRKVERVKLKPIATDKLKHGDIVKFKERSNQKFVVAYYTEDIIFFHPTSKNEYAESEGLIPFMRSYSVIVYKLLNLKELCK